MVVMHFARKVNVELRGVDAAAIHARQTQFVTFHAELGQFRFQEFEIQPAIQQRADEHVAAGTRKTIQIKRPHTFCQSLVLSVWSD